MSDAPTTAAAPDRQFTVILADGRTFGPADGSLLKQWVREGRVPADALVRCGESIPPMRAAEVPELSALFNAPPVTPGPLSVPESSGSGIESIIPFRNGFALGSYYVGVCSLIPIFGIILGPLAIIFGVLGLRYAASRPAARGRVHAWVGIVLGTLVILGHIAFFALVVPHLK